jgi:protein O-mannosyl-transferase
MRKAMPYIKNPAIHYFVYIFVILISGIVVYFNSFNGVFIFDDSICVTDALEIRTLFPPWDAMFGGIHYPRPIAGLSFAINYAISGLDIWSYHLFNLIIHMTAGLALFGILVVTLNRTPYKDISSILALVISLIWLVHPLQTESVTYITQRYESLMGMFFLLSVFCYTLSSRSSGRKTFWQGLSILFCYLGAGTKQVAALIPIIVLFYDRTFITQSFKDTLSRSWRYLLILFSSWIPLLIIGITAKPFDWAGFDMEVVTPWKFAVSEFGVIVHYMKLAFWPDNLVFDYFWQLADTPAKIIPFALIILALVLLSLRGLVKNHPFGFLGISFFSLLAPTSSIMPLSDLAADHRMYLPLVPVITISVLTIHFLCQRLPVLFEKSNASPEKGFDFSFSSKPGTIAFAFFSLFIIVVFSTLTIERNALFASKSSIWKDTAEKAPHNPRAWANLGNALIEEKRYNEALAPLKKALELKPNYSVVLINLGFLYNLKNDAEKAIYYWEKSLERKSHHRTHYNLGLLYQLHGNKKKAVTHFQQAVTLKPRWTPALIRLAWLYATDASTSRKKKVTALTMAEAVNRSVENTNPFYLDTLAAAYAANLQFEKARQTQTQAVKLVKNMNAGKILSVMLFRLNKYQNNQPFTLKPDQIDLTVRVPR